MHTHVPFAPIYIHTHLVGRTPLCRHHVCRVRCDHVIGKERLVTNVMSPLNMVDHLTLFEISPYTVLQVCPYKSYILLISINLCSITLIESDPFPAEISHDIDHRLELVIYTVNSAHL